MSRKYRKKGYAERLKYMHMLEDGYSIDYIVTHHGISHHLLGFLWTKYQSEDPSGLIKKKNIKLEDFDEDMQKHILEELHKQEKRRRLMVVLCSLMAVACFAYFGLYHYFIERTDNTYEQWAELREKDTNKDVGTFTPVTVNKIEAEKDIPDILEKYKTLYNKNKSLIGWIKIADTNIDYPVMQTSNIDYYMDSVPVMAWENSHAITVTLKNGRLASYRQQLCSINRSGDMLNAGNMLKAVDNLYLSLSDSTTDVITVSDIFVAYTGENNISWCAKIDGMDSLIVLDRAVN